MKTVRNIQHYKIVLASNSPRRRELLSGLNLEYTVRVLPDIDESYPDTLKGEEIPMYISREKAEAYRNSMAEDELIITADTVVCINEKVLGKPQTLEEAKEMLRELSGEDTPGNYRSMPDDPWPATNVLRYYSSHIRRTDRG